MKMKQKVLWVFGIVLFQTAFLSCVNDKKKDPNDTAIVKFEDEMEPVDEMIFYRFPSPEEIFRFIKSSDLQYNDGSLNNPSNFKKYSGLKQQALNLGVYISDLAYITMFEQNEASLDYFMSIHALSEELKISAAFDEPLIQRIGENIGNTDSLVVVAGDAYSNIVDYLDETEKGDILALISAGALIESLHLTIDYIDTYSEDNQLITKILDQKFVISNLSLYVKQNLTDKEIIEGLDKLNELYANLEEADSETTVEKTDDNKLVIGGGKQLSVNAEDFAKLKECIEDIRNNYINIE